MKPSATGWLSPEKIQIGSQYSSKDYEHLKFGAGIPPYLRGPYATMYTVRPWTIRQYAAADRHNAARLLDRM